MIRIEEKTTPAHNGKYVVTSRKIYFLGILISTTLREIV